jgi:uncharacterized protein YecE (DUF72 family)
MASEASSRVPVILLGTCGWSYAEWEGIFYPQKQSKLRQYCSIFSTTEVDSTFYSPPRDEIVVGWAKHTPEDFVFSAKLPQTVTHKKTLDVRKGIETDLTQFLQTMKPLTDAGKLGCILAQLPPFLKYDAERFESFLSVLPGSPSFAVEFRHNSWMNDHAFKLLEKYKVAYTIVDEPLLPPEIHVTSEIAYIRWHGRGSRPWFNYKYSEDQLKEWVPRVKQIAGKARKVFGYFNNHFHGYAPENSLQMMRMLGIVTSHGYAALQRLTLSRIPKKAHEIRGLEAWTGPIGVKGVQALLLRNTDSEVLEAAQLIPDSDFSLREDSKRRLAAYVGDTTVEIDFQERAITHYCPAWSRSVFEKKFCEHVLKLFLAIRPERSRNILSLIHSNLDSWKFESRLAVEFPT